MTALLSTLTRAAQTCDYVWISTHEGRLKIYFRGQTWGEDLDLTDPQLEQKLIERVAAYTREAERRQREAADALTQEAQELGLDYLDQIE